MFQQITSRKRVYPTKRETAKLSKARCVRGGEKSTDVKRCRCTVDRVYGPSWIVFTCCIPFAFGSRTSVVARFLVSMFRGVFEGASVFEVGVGGDRSRGMVSGGCFRVEMYLEKS